MIGRAAFRVDSATTIGAGHLTRCLTLAGSLAKSGVISRFVGRNHEGHLLDLASAAGHETIVLEAAHKATHDPATWIGATVEADAQDTVAALQDIMTVDWLIVDHYGIDATWHDRVSRACTRMLAIDDLANRPLRVDVLLDHNYGAPEKPYAQAAPQARRLLGPQYALLDPRLEHARARARATTPRPECESRVLVSLGGSDPDDVTSWILSILSDDLSRAAGVNVVIGRSHPAPHAVERACRALHNAQLYVQASDMPSLLADADVAIGAGGVSTLERACIGVPTLAVALAANQVHALRALDRDGLLMHVDGFHDEPGIVQQRYRDLVSELERRRRMSAACRQAVDGRGLERVLHELLGGRPEHLRQIGGNHA